MFNISQPPVRYKDKHSQKTGQGNDEVTNERMTLVNTGMGECTVLLENKNFKQQSLYQDGKDRKQHMETWRGAGRACGEKTAKRQEEKTGAVSTKKKRLFVLKCS